MSTSPLPPDPYEALGVSRDAETDIIKKSYRKLVLKHHPDRIKDPSLIEQAQNEFHKVQQAYELLVDPVTRQRYDDEVKLAQLRKERMMSQREAPRSQGSTFSRTTYSARPTPAPTQPVQRETRPDARYAYEERAPESYFDGAHGKAYDEPVPRSTARKDHYEKRPSATKPVEKKEKPKSTAWDRGAGGIPWGMAFGLKEKAAGAKKKVQEKEEHSRNAKSRSKDIRGERLDKQARTRAPQKAYVESDPDSSDSDTVVATPRRPMARERSPQPIQRERSPKPQARGFSREIPRELSPRGIRRDRSPVQQPRRHLTPEPPRNRRPSPHRSSVSDAEEYASPDEWESKHNHARAYIHRSNVESGRAPPGRPQLSRQNSEQKYWAAPKESPRDHHRSGSDSDRQRPGSSSQYPRRTMAQEGGDRPRRPNLQPHTSAPPGMPPTTSRGSTRDVPLRENPTRPRQGSYDSRVPFQGNHRQLFAEQPGLNRTNSDPVSPRVPMGGAGRKDTAPAKPSTLKQEANQNDSGYGSSSPHTPEMRGESPPAAATASAPPLQRRETATTAKYRVRKDDDDGHHRARKVSDDGGEIRKFLSPESAQQSTHVDERNTRRSSRSRERSRSNRPQTERRPSFSRGESSGRYEEQRPRAKTLNQSPERSSSYARKVDRNDVKFSSPGRLAFAPRYEDTARSEAAMHRTSRGRKASAF